MNAKRAAAVVLVVAILVALAVLPVFVKKDNIINLACLSLLYVALASSWNILGGYAGQTNLGHAAFFGLGTLITRFTWLAGWPLWAALLAGAFVPVVFAMLIGAPAFRLRGAYFAIGTLALAQALNVAVSNRWPMITSLPARYLATYRLMPRYYLFLAVAIAAVGVTYCLVKSRVGLGLMAVREEEDAAESLGVSGLRHKLLALGVSAFLAGLAGGAFAFYHVGYYPQFPFNPVWTFDAVMATYIGGMGTIVGPIVGAVFYVLVKELLALKVMEAHLIIFGTLFIVVVLFLPGGLLEAWGKIRSALGGRAKARKAAFPTG